MKNFDPVPQLKRFSYVHQCAARSRHDSHSRQCRYSLLQRQLAALLQCGPAGHGFGGLIQQLQDQSPEPLVWTVKGVLTEQWIESNWIESTRLWHWLESNRFFLPNRPSLVNNNNKQWRASELHDSDVLEQYNRQNLQMCECMTVTGVLCVMCRFWADKRQGRVWPSRCSSVWFADSVTSYRCRCDMHVATAASRPAPQCCAGITASSSRDCVFTSSTSLLPTTGHDFRGNVLSFGWCGGIVVAGRTSDLNLRWCEFDSYVKCHRVKSWGLWHCISIFCLSAVSVTVTICRGSGGRRGLAPLEYLYGSHPWPIVYILYRRTYNGPLATPTIKSFLGPWLSLLVRLQLLNEHESWDPVVRLLTLLLWCVKERESMTDDQLAEMSTRYKVAKSIRCIVTVLRASHAILPAACWYAAKVFWACSRARKLEVSSFIFTKFICVYFT